jgi:hypothetical protein
MILRANAWLVPAIIAAMFAMAASALASDSKPPAETLPGVEGNYRIVKPYAPEPEPDDARPAKAGGWDIKVSGAITVDIGAGRLPLPHH